jgi:hypothetical protein
MADVHAYDDQDAAGEWSRFDRYRTEFAVALRALRGLWISCCMWESTQGRGYL